MGVSLECPRSSRKPDVAGEVGKGQGWWRATRPEADDTEPWQEAR